MSSVKVKKGDLLIAEPSILIDVTFNRSVIIMADCNPSGAVGFILNKPLDYSLKDLIENTSSDFTIYNGGPVEQDNLYFIHNKPELIPDSIEIANGIFWGGDFDTTMALINSHSLTELDVRFFLGYSGWENEQLNEEVTAKTWLVSPNIYESKLIESCDSGIWKQKMLELDDRYSIWSNAPEHPSYN